jgi:pantetheine-phosphate adenylyltransferase
MANPARAELQPKALYGGSFDPPTNGHLDVIERTADIFPSVEVHVAVNPGKTPYLEINRRLELLEEITESLGNVTVGHSVEEFLVSYAAENDFTTLVRGLRTEKDFGDESNLLKINHLIRPDIDTIYIPCRPDYEAVSSTAVKQIIAGDPKGWEPVVAKIVPPTVLQALVARQAAL